MTASRPDSTETRGARDESLNPELQALVHRNIAALLAMRERYERQKGVQERVADAITRFSGSMPFVYLHAVGFGLWIVVNTGVLGIRPFDPFPFVMLAMFASVEAIFLSTFVLISQNRMARLADRRADLDVQINLLAEHEVTRLLLLVERIADRVGVPNEVRPDTAPLQQDVPPEKVLEQLENVGGAPGRPG